MTLIQHSLFCLALTIFCISCKNKSMQPPDNKIDPNFDGNNSNSSQNYINFPLNYTPSPIEEEEYCFDDSLEEDVYESLRYIRDPEFPKYTLVNLGVITPSSIKISNENSHFSIVQVTFKPTAAHCSMASLIGLSIRKKLETEFGTTCKIDLAIAKNSHDDEIGLTRQINDKERVTAALENPYLSELVESAIEDNY